MRRLLLSGVSIIALSASVQAQSLSVPIAPWTGFYAGATFGAVAPSGKHEVSGDPNAQAPIFSATGSSGAIAGIFAGYNHQFSPYLVVGIETDLSKLDASKKLSATSDFPTHWPSFDGEDFYGNANLVGKTSLNWLGTLRLRAGTTIGPVFVYGTGGLAYGGARSRTLVSVPENFPDRETLSWSGGSSKTMVGWAAGFGGEVMLSPLWTFRAEFLHYDLGSVSYAMVTVDLDGGGYPTFATSAKVGGNIARFGIAYRF